MQRKSHLRKGSNNSQRDPSHTRANDLRSQWEKKPVTVNQKTAEAGKKIEADAKQADEMDSPAM